VKAAELAYARPASLSEVLDLLQRTDVETRILAGGQSLMPSLNMRLTKPAVLVDLGGLGGMDGISEVDGAIHIGAMTRHASLASSELVRSKLPLIAKAVPHIAHPAIRNRGTIGGSLALGDPATELPACALALDAIIVAASNKGERRIAAAQFFRGLYETALEPTEVLTAIEIPVPPASSVTGFDEFVRRHGDYALVGLAAQGVCSPAGWTSLRLAFFGIGDRPLLAEAAAKELVSGAGVAAAQAALDGVLQPLDDLECTAKTKMHLARVLLARVCSRMSERGDSDAH
jgi:carbon-monoxide dehydrogenase medium subunit